MADLQTRVAILEERDVHTANAIQAVDRKIDRVIEGLDKDQAAKRTTTVALIVAALALTGTLLAALIPIIAKVAGA